MIDPDTYESNKGRPAWVRRHRDELQELTGLEIPRTLPAVADWLDGHQPHMTRRIRDHFDADESTDTDSEESANGGGE